MSTQFDRETQLSEEQPPLRDHTTHSQGYDKYRPIPDELLVASRILGESGRLEEAWEAIDQAARLCRQALADTYSPTMLTGPESSHRNQLHPGDLDRLEKAIEYESRALALTPDGHPDLSRRPLYLGRAPINQALTAGSRIDMCICISSKDIEPSTLSVSKSYSPPTRSWCEAKHTGHSVLRDPDLIKTLSSVGLLLLMAISWSCCAWM